ncbi:acyl-ACP--UDP-N-acetylglucosamine O-acyltransferase [Acidobacteria bacterium AH-259-A15]|nr:acyl-ACP--UDP-N-acetylglucosamine O-acyltransferase [Acidobacteria bacterium AH-259-A15]
MGDALSREIHETAVISPGAEIAHGVRIGPYAVIGDEVTLGEGSIVGPHTVIEGPTIIGKQNHIMGQSAIGTNPQDLKYRGEKSFLLIGDENVIREFVTINRGSAGGGGKTTIGNKNVLMTGVHIAHDCHVGQGTILVNSATLGGHVEIADYSTVGAFTGIHQFCRVGAYAFIGGYSVLTRDALPFVKTVGERNQARIYGINRLGLRRKNFSSQRIEALKRAYRWLFQKGLKVGEAIEKIQEEGLDTEDVSSLIQFIETSKRGFVRQMSGFEQEEGGS